MHIILPPSETKRSGGGSVFSAAALSHGGELSAARMRVRDALVALSGDEDAAAKALKLGVKNRGELAHNLALAALGEGPAASPAPPAMPVIERYTGVLYDALDAMSLDAGARTWLDGHVSVQSALFGLVGAGEQIPAYRLSASSRLPELGAPLKRVWGEAHAALDWASFGWVLDLRSNDYAALAPLPADRGLRLHVAQRSANGEVRALNHFNKAAKGDLVRRLAVDLAEIDGPEALLEWAAGAGIELAPGACEGELTLLTELGAPNRGA